MQQQIVPGKWAFNAWLGLEHEYVNDLDALVDEDTYVAGQIGTIFTAKSGQQLVLNYTRHQGVNGNRWNQMFLATLNIPF
ncbi:hypothetical protein [uncultured Roseovarius sp.]|uniref:hypothetical protein n=1 Tax=uncultured Roseovarius sp. TaxID=293344 RepID=UPI0026353641|nr:hypothetical protein [uncultured Roseovarius sp.]